MKMIAVKIIGYGLGLYSDGIRLTVGVVLAGSIC